MSGSSGFGIGEAGATAGGAVIGTILGNVMNTRRQHRLAREAARYLGPGEKMAARIAVAIAKYYAIVLTDRRLLLFRAKRRIRPRLRKIQIGVPRSQVSMGIEGWIDGTTVSLSFAPATGIPPVLLNGAAAADARAIHEALTTGATGGRVSTPPRAA